MSDGSYRAGPWKCPLSWCHDSEQHHHTNESLIAKIAALESSLREAEAALQGRTVSCVCGGRAPVAATPDAGKAGEK
jgi:hypothetical protein